uniref:Pectinesterase n=1 Tax=Oryza brachyantha TaxID=4533 RepID=J3M083_ORYBR
MLTLGSCIPMAWQNTAPAPMPGMQGWQAVAFRISGDKAFFFGCGFYGAQDTLCDDAGRHYFRDCYIEGSIDFIFGNGRTLYKDCELHSTAQRFGSVAAQGRHDPCERTGFAFVNCRVTGTGRLYLGPVLADRLRLHLLRQRHRPRRLGRLGPRQQQEHDGVLRDVQELGPRRGRRARRAVGAGARLLRRPPLPRQELRQWIPLAHT